MGLQAVLESTKFKKVMVYVYGWGATVVLVGAMFKIMHWPGAGPMLVVGLSVEALIFFLAGLEPYHPEIDWTRVYPELIVHEGEETSHAKAPKKAEKKGTPAIDKFEESLQSAGLQPEVFQRLSEGLKNLTTTSAKIGDISDAVAATSDYTKNIKTASSSVATLADTYQKSSAGIAASSDSYKQAVESLNFSVDGLNDAYGKSSVKVSEAGSNFVTAYNKLSQAMNIDFSGLAEGNKNYTTGLASLNKNLSALNAIFELQLQEADLEKMMTDLQGSVEQSAKYNKEITKLGRQLEALNTVYGNMLAAMNVQVK